MTTRDRCLYPLLPEGVDAFRLLTLEPGGFSEPLICKLRSVAFRPDPHYVALSYTWEDSYRDNATLPTVPSHSQVFDEQPAAHERSRSLPDPITTSHLRRSSRTPEPETFSTQITLNDVSFGIQHNLYLALLHVRSLTDPLTLWVDSICINQQDGEELNRQLAMMSRIYNRAITVLAWIGTQTYRNKLDLFRSMALDWKRGPGHQFAAFIAKVTEALIAKKEAPKFLSSREPDPRTFARLAESEYWTRLWIVQEICLARGLVVMYGSQTWSWDDLRSWEVLKTCRSRPLSPISMLDAGEDSFEAMLHRIDTRDQRFSEEMRFERLLETFSKSACSKPKDRVYGLLGLANDVHPFSEPQISQQLYHHSPNTSQLRQLDPMESAQGSRMFEVDYRRSYSTLWKYVVQFLYNQDSPNNGKDGSCLDLPDSIQTRIVRVAAILQEALGQNVQREIDQSEVFEIKHEQPTIRAVGFLCSNIIHIGPQYSTLIGSFRAEQEWHFSWEKHYPKPADLAILRAEADKYLSRLLNMGDEDLARIQAINSSTTVAWHVETDPGNPEPYLSSFFTEKYNEETGRLLAEPMICLGTNHLVALVPPTSKNGDVIVRFWRSSTAIVLRPVPRGFLEPIYALIGRAYVLSSEKTHMMLDTESQDLYATAQRTGRVFMDTDFRTLQAITASTCE